MCGRYTSTTPVMTLAEHFQVDEVKVEPLEPSWNVAPTQPVYAIAERRVVGPGRGPRQLGLFRWGLVPAWAESPSNTGNLINARAETVATKPAYRRALSRRRCIIPADAFYEWRVTGVVAGKKIKQPYASCHRDGTPLAFAGLWEVWHDPTQPDAEPLRSCVIITAPANELLRPIHDRMPVVLAAAAWDGWLDRDRQGSAALQRLLVPAPDADFTLWPVASLVNRPAANGAELLEPVDEADPQYAS